MRILPVFLIGHGLSSDPCAELCAADGPTLCTASSVVTTDTEGNEFCSNYYYQTGRRTYSVTPIEAQPVPLGDVPRLLAEIAMAMGREEMIWDIVSVITDDLEDIRTVTDGLEELAELRLRETSQSISRLLNPPATTSLITFLAAALRQGTAVDDFVMLPLVAAMDLRMSAEGRKTAASAVGLTAYCSEFMDQIMAKLTRLDTDKSTHLLTHMGHLHEFCPEVLTAHPEYRRISLSCQIAGLSSTLRFASPVQSWSDLGSVSVEAIRRNLLATIDVSYSGVETLTRWIQVEEEYLALAGLLKYTSDDKYIEFSSSRLRSAGRFLALALLQRVPLRDTVDMGLCAYIMDEAPETVGVTLPYTLSSRSNWGIIATSFREVIPLDVLKGLQVTPSMLHGMFHGI